MRYLIILLLFTSFAQGQMMDKFMKFGAADPYTAGTNLLPDMAGNKDYPTSSGEVTGGWTDSGGTYVQEGTIVRTGTSAIKFENSSGSTSDDIIAYNWNPPDQGNGKDWRWEGYVYVPSASSGGTLQLEIGDNNGSVQYNIDESLTDQWVFFSFDFSQTTTNTFRTMEMQGDETYYLDDMKYLDITP